MFNCPHLWDIKINTPSDIIPHLRAPAYCSLQRICFFKISKQIFQQNLPTHLWKTAELTSFSVMRHFAWLFQHDILCVLGFNNLNTDLHFKLSANSVISALLFIAFHQYVYVASTPSKIITAKKHFCLLFIGSHLFMNCGSTNLNGQLQKPCCNNK